MALPRSENVILISNSTPRISNLQPLRASTVVVIFFFLPLFFLIILTCLHARRTGRRKVITISGRKRTIRIAGRGSGGVRGRRLSRRGRG